MLSPRVGNISHLFASVTRKKYFQHYEIIIDHNLNYNMRYLFYFLRDYFGDSWL